MKVFDDKKIQCRVKIEGSYNGEFFIYEDEEGTDGSQFIWPDGDPSKYWWEDGNMGCDCNRYQFLPEHLKVLHNGECGHEIQLYKITPIEGTNLPILELEEEIFRD